MYGELPHTGFGAMLLTGVALAITGVGFVLTRLGRKPAGARG